MKKKKYAALLLALTVIFAAALLPGCRQTAESGEKGMGLRADAMETLSTLEKVDENFYRMTYKTDYALDKLLAQGAEDDRALAAFVSKQLLYGLPFNHKVMDLACSTFAARTPEGEYIQGRNLDINGSQNILVYTRPDKGYASLSMANGLLLGYIDSMPDTDAGRLLTLAAPYYPVDGINEKGVSVAILLLSGSQPVYQNRGKTPITTTLAIRMILDRAATVKEATDLMEQYDMRSICNANLHFHLADAAGDSAVIEYVDGEMQVIRSEGYGQVATNFFLSPDAVEKVRDGEDRLKTLQSVLDADKGVVGAEKAWRMLDSVKMEHVYDEDTGIDFNTAYSIVFNNTKHTMDICVNMNFDKIYSYQVGKDF